MEKIYLERIAQAGFTVLRAEGKDKIMYLSRKNPDKWRVFQDGFTTSAARDRRMKDLLSQHKNYVQSAGTVRKGKARG